MVWCLSVCPSVFLSHRHKPWMLPAGCVDCWCSSGQVRGRSGGRHCTAGQYGYVPLGIKDFVNFNKVMLEYCRCICAGRALAGLCHVCSCCNVCRPVSASLSSLPTRNSPSRSVSRWCTRNDAADISPSRSCGCGRYKTTSVPPQKVITYDCP